MFSVLMEGSKKELTEIECLFIAENEAKLSNDAQLILSEFQSIGDNEVFLVRWHHFHKGVWVESDCIQVMENASTGKVFSHQRHWHNINSKLTEQ
jgi:bisphosphoglycerate-independent phosphoglycerate mutase (AlkP superfamily)